MVEKKCLNCDDLFKTKRGYSDKRYCDNCHISKRKIKKPKKENIYKKCKRCGGETEFERVKHCTKCNKIVLEKRYKVWKENNNNRGKNSYLKYKDDPIRGIKKRLQLKVSARRKYNTDKNHQIAVRLRNCLRMALKSYTREGKTTSSRNYGINYKDIIEKLKPFPEDLSKYHIDHILPCCSFDLEDKDQVKKCFSPENLRWLLKEDNLKKIKEDKLMSRKRFL